MARRGPIAFRIIAGFLGLAIGVVAAVTVLISALGKAPPTAPAPAQPQATTHGP